MTTRYFSFTDGTRTYFRASKTKVYQSGWASQAGCGFSTKPVPTGQYPATEITKTEYDALTKAKNARITQAGRNPSYAVPQDSWVKNGVGG